MGCILIFNNHEFDNKDIRPRNGSHKDVERLTKVFHLFNFRIKVVQDPTIKDIRENMNHLLNENLEHCLVIVIMSHGEENNIAHARDGTYSIVDEIMCSEVFNKPIPKLIFTQACKVPVDKNVKKNRENTNQNAKRDPTVLRFDSAFEGHPAHRDPNDGSPFIKILCEHLHKYGYTLDIRDIIAKVQIEFGKQWKAQQSPTETNYGFDKLCLGERAQQRFNVNDARVREFVI